MRTDVAEVLARHGAHVVESTCDPRADVAREAWVALHTDLAASGLEFSDLTALDRGDAVELVCFLLISPTEQFSVRTSCPDGDLHAPSLTGIYPPANWAEREVYDLFGVVLDGHPDLTRILQPDDATIFPLRKSFELTVAPW